MNNTMEIVAQAAIINILLGSILTLAVVCLFRLYRFNAATRHSIWLVTLLLIAFMPLLLLSPRPDWIPTASDSAIAPAAGLPVLVIDAGGNPSPVARNADSATAEPMVDAYATQPFVWQALAIILGLGFVLKLCFLIRAACMLQRLYRQSTPVSIAISNAAETLSEQLDLSATPAICQNGNIGSPLAGGMYKHWILLPSELCNGRPDDTMLRQVLLHELAHIKRHDVLVAWFQSLIGLFLFWHPAVHFINRQLVLEREIASDDWVLACLGGDRQAGRSYASSLVRIAESINDRRSVGLAVACVRGKGQLTQRIGALLNRQIDHDTRPKQMPKVSVALIATVFLALSTPLWPQLPYAQEETNSESFEADGDEVVLGHAENVTRDKNSGKLFLSGDVEIESDNILFLADHIDGLNQAESSADWQLVGAPAMARLTTDEGSHVWLLGRRIVRRDEPRELSATKGFVVFDDGIAASDNIQLNIVGNQVQFSGGGKSIYKKVATPSDTDRMLEHGGLDDIEKTARFISAVQSNNIAVAELYLESGISSKRLIQVLLDQIPDQNSAMANLLAEAKPFTPDK